MLFDRSEEREKAEADKVPSREEKLMFQIMVLLISQQPNVPKYVTGDAVSPKSAGDKRFVR